MKHFFHTKKKKKYYYLVFRKNKGHLLEKFTITFLNINVEKSKFTVKSFLQQMSFIFLKNILVIFFLCMIKGFILKAPSNNNNDNKKSSNNIKVMN